MEFETSNDTERGGGKFLDKPGTYHLIVTEVNEQPTNKANEVVENAFEMTVQALEGTVRSDDKFTEEERITNLWIFGPNLTQTEKSQAFAKKKMTILFLATNLIREDAVGGKKVKLDLQDLVNQQFIATLAQEDNSKFLDFNYADIWHVDDPDAAFCPKSKQGLSHLPKERRRTADSFKKSKKKEEEKKEAVPAGALSDDELNDL